ncbi:MAG: malate dehydrogenase, partial [Actinomycetia bacterium]|nr:malate dehydrogenase [Actinomycetes bacterium]
MSSYPQVSIVGAGNVGATAALFTLMHDLADVVLIDVAEGLPQGKALDLMHTRSIEQFGPTVRGTNDYAETAGSDLIVITAGVARKPGMTRDDLLSINAKIMGEVIEQAVAASPDALVLCVTNPLDIMTYLAYKESGLPAHRVLGMGGVLDSARFTYAIAEATGAPLDRIEALAIGAHGDAMTPMPAHSLLDGKPITAVLEGDAVDALVERTTFGGAEVVALLKTGSAFVAPAASVVAMIRALLSPDETTLPACVYLQGEYGIDDVYMSVPARISDHGVVGVVELDLDENDLARLRGSAETVASALDELGLR